MSAPRPRPDEASVILRAAVLLGHKLAGQRPDLGAPDVSMTMQLAAALRHADAYDIAHQLDHAAFWRVDAGLVRLLDQHAQPCRDQAWAEALKRWVRDNGLRSDFGCGAGIDFTWGPRQEEELHGIISYVEHDTGFYRVYVEGRDPNSLLVPWEWVRPRQRQAKAA